MYIDFRRWRRGVAYKVLTNVVVPRPIAWVTSKDAGGLNWRRTAFSM